MNLALMTNSELVAHSYASTAALTPLEAVLLQRVVTLDEELRDELQAVEQENNELKDEIDALEAELDELGVDR